MTKSKPLIAAVVFCSGFMAGLIQPYFGYGFALVVAILVLLTKFRTAAVLFGLVLLIGFNFGLARGQIYSSDLKVMQVLLGRELVIRGTISEDLSYHKSGQREFHIQNLKLSLPYEKELHGRIRVRSYQANNLYRGNKVEISGKMYRALGNRHGTIQYADIKQLDIKNSVVESFRLKFFAATHSVLPDPESSLGLGFLLGGANTLPDELNEDLRQTGLTHIVAVSGYNLTILVLLTQRIFAGKSKRLATIAAIGLLIFFLLLTGGAPSIVRASIVSFIAIAAGYYGRKVNPLVLLLISMTISSYINPYFLWKDIGWYLSFTAFFGVLVLAPLITKRIYKREPKLFGQLVIETSCAQLLTLPIVTYIFGSVSVISMVANLVVLPFVPFAMATTFVVGISGLLAPHFAGIFVIPGRFVLHYIVEVTKFLAESPYAITQIKISLSQLALSYVIIFLICAILYLKTQANTLKTELE